MSEEELSSSPSQPPHLNEHGLSIFETRVGPQPDAQEQRRLIEEWGRAPANYPQIDMGRVFKTQAQRQPHALALVDGPKEWTYAALDAAADRVGRGLILHGVQPGEPVGLFMPRSAAMVLGMLGTLKAGAAYLPLDPTYPLERLRAMLQISGARLLLTNQAVSADLAMAGVTNLRLEEMPEADGVSLPEGIPIDGISHVLFTSGSTGQPKGVPLTHRGLLRLFLNNNFWNVQPGERVSQISNMSFDGASIEVWGALFNGGCLVITPQETLLDPLALGRFWREQHIDHVYIPTALFHLAATLQPQIFRNLRTVLFGGEAGSPQAVRQVLAQGQAPRIINLYGPTETTVAATFYICNHLAQDALTLPIGKTLSGSEVFILDEQQQIVPIGVAGEIYLAGDGLSPGYLNRPDLTAERFMPVSLPGRPPRRMYRTGDRGRWTEDGNIEYLGRLDTQVKLRGYRIELSEVENAALQYPAVYQAAALARDDPGVGRRLALYIALRSSAGEVQAEVQALRQSLGERLPVYMLPGIIQVVERMPLNPNGKVDHAALLALPPQMGAGGDAAAGQLPQNDLERLLAGVWQDIFGMPRVNRDANFFDLGGHSLLAVRLTALVNELLGLNAPLRTIMETPRLADYAQALRVLSGQPDELEGQAGLVLEILSLSEDEAEERLDAGGAAASPLPAAQPPAEIEDEFPLSHIQAGMLFAIHDEPQARRFILQWVTDLYEEVDAPLLRRAWQQVIDHHVTHRSSFHLVEMAQRVHRHATVDWMEADWRGAPEAELEARFDEFLRSDRQAGVDVTRAPAFRVALFRLADKHYRMVRSSSHLIHDGRSSVLIYKQVFGFYDALRRGESYAFDPTPSYREYVAWLEAQAEMSSLPGSQARRFWQSMLGGVTLPSPLPYDRRPAPAPAPSGPMLPARRERRLTLLQSDGVGQAAQSQGVSLNILAQAAWALTLSRLTNRRRVVFGAPRACRRGSCAQAEWMVGPLVNTLPLRVEVDPQARLDQFLGRLQAAWREMRPFEAASLSDIRRWVGLAPFEPIFESILNFSQASFAAAARGEIDGAEHRLFNYRQGLDGPLALNFFGDREILLWLEHDPRRISPDDGGRLMDNFIATLLALAEASRHHPQAKLAEILTWDGNLDHT